MPTFQRTPRFDKDWVRLSREERERFMSTVLDKIVPDLTRGTFRAGLRVKDVESRPGVWEMSWAPDGPATFSYGPEQRVGQPHIIWRRIGTHDIFRNP